MGLRYATGVAHAYRHATLSHVSWITADGRVISQEIVMECSSSTSSAHCGEDLENVCAVLAADTVTVRRKVCVRDINMKRKEKGEFQHLVRELEKTSKSL